MRTLLAIMVATVIAVACSASGPATAAARSVETPATSLHGSASTNLTRIGETRTTCIGSHWTTPAVLRPAVARSAYEQAAPNRGAGSPSRRIGGASGGTLSTSPNWAGYDVRAGTYTSVTATWTQPAVLADASVYARSSFWAGLDGDGSGTVEQCGTAAVDQYGSVAYYAWYEMYPAPEIPFSGLAIRPGDRLRATVTTDGAGNYTLTVANYTIGLQSTINTFSADTQNYSAEVIAEAPTNLATNQMWPLANFGTVNFSNCAFNGYALSAWNWNRINMVSNGTTAATTSAIGGDGASFSVTAGAPDVTAPTTTVSGADSNWHQGPVTLTFSAGDNTGGSGVAYTEYSLDGGTNWTRGTSATIAAPADHSNDGAHTIQYRSADNAGNVEAAHSCQVNIDTLGPVCAAKNASVRRGRSCRLYFKIHDQLSPKVTNVLTISTPSGVVKKQWSWNYGENFSGYWWTKYRCRLARGIYILSVYGKDLAGNAQSVVGRGYLRVK